MEQNFDYINHYKIDAEEFDYFESKYGATLHDERRVHEFVFSQVNKNIDSILDVGCGSAWISSKYVPLNKKVYSLDISKKNIARALESCRSTKHNGIVADSFYLPFKKNSFDLVVACEIIEHVVSPDDFIKALYKTVKPGGRLILSTPYKEILRYYLCINCNKKTPVNAHIHSFDENIIKKIMYNCRINNYKQILFGNKILIFIRTYIILKYFPFLLWKIVDQITNVFFNYPTHLLLVINKEK